MGKLLYTVAINSVGELVFADGSEKGEHYSCAVCDSKLTLKKSGRTGPRSKRPHFAHLTLTPNCAPETALHFTFKSLLAKLLNERLAASEPFHFSWHCEFCGQRHEGDLLKATASVQLEYDLGECRPDLALIDGDGEVKAAIEIVVTHKPTDDAIEFYRKNRIALVQVNLFSESDLDDIEGKAGSPGRVTVCRNPRCDQCGRFTQHAYMALMKGRCWSCGDRMRVALIELKGKYYKRILDPRKFTKADLELASAHGVKIIAHSRPTYRDKYFACTCPSCNKFVSTFQLHNSWLNYEAKKVETAPRIYIGTRCDHDDTDPEF